MRHKWIPIVIVTALAVASLVVAGTDGRWIHMRVQEHGNEEAVSINVPLSMAVSLVPMIDDDDFRHGRVRIDDDDYDSHDLRRMLEAVRDAPDAEFVTVRSRDESVRVAKENGYLLVRAEEKAGNERVRVRVPMAVVEAMLTHDGREIDLGAALQALADHPGEDLVTIEDEESLVRIWIDDSETGE